MKVFAKGPDGQEHELALLEEADFLVAKDKHAGAVGVPIYWCFPQPAGRSNVMWPVPPANEKWSYRFEDDFLEEDDPEAGEETDDDGEEETDPASEGEDGQGEE